MFEGVQAPQVNAPKLAQPVTTLAPSAALVVKPPGDAEIVDLLKRASLTTWQKLVLVVITMLILGGVFGGGLWLYLWLQPFKTPAVTNSANAPANYSNINNIPLYNLDTDQDGLRDIDERKYGTDINAKDTDADGLSDGEEVNIYQTKPTNSDTDQDGYKDGYEEVFRGYNPNGPGKLNR